MDNFNEVLTNKNNISLSIKEYTDNSINCQKNDFKRNLMLKISNYFINKPFPGSTTMLFLLSKAILKKYNYPVIVNTNYNFYMLLNLKEDSAVEATIYYLGTYEPGTLHIMEKCLCSDDIFIDVGANIGLMSLFASKILKNTGKVYSFEPEPSTFDILQKNIFINHSKNIRTLSYALGSKNETLEVYKNANKNRGKATLMVSEETEESGTHIEVKTMDDFIYENSISEVKFVKIDVEGWELEVLKGAKLLLSSKNAPILCVEYIKNRPVANGKSIDIYNFLNEINSYRFFKLEKGCYKISKLKEIFSEKDLPSGGNIFCMTSRHIDKLPKDLFFEVSYF